MSQPKTRKLLLFLVTIPLLALAIFFANGVYQDSIKRSEIKDDYSTLNYIDKGILSVTAWKEAMTKIAKHQIEEFELTEKQDSLLHLQLTELIRSLVDQADSTIKANDQGFKGTIRKWAVQTFVDPNEVKAGAPHFSRSIIDEVMKEENKDRMKTIAVSKMNEFAEETYSRQDSLEVLKVYEKYEMSLDENINSVLLKKASQLEDQNYREAFYIIGIIVIFLLLWLFVFKYNDLQKPLFFMSILLAIVVLLTGLTSAMIEIDARIDQVDFVLLGENVQFKDQVIFYQSKSILQMVTILLQTGKIDSIFVGALVLAFSVILPISKLISTQVYLFGKEKWQNNKVIFWLAFKSGKWSMADVMVVAIFMAYVGFNGILEDQMEYLNVDTETMTSIATNNTSLQPGYILFIAYVLFGLILAAILKGIIKRQKKRIQNS
ncbi:paraquat-inducible protein A [Brumimicrobium aurantiacum]|uniref:Paraquat-inducible protein A n=1 Tax=Brumimicrobium aurantiacum TaxID=1737063 RepID=A0A3E1F0G2_9FLAO|nr:paraquat-inducible protein A [Brumimicrobium aurantiacum]RFC55312.1 paraquat-inducible protein A [Brumimicrobium aurantiacum]